jgi:putative nucleotidyltransferase with HDIG domain
VGSVREALVLLGNRTVLTLAFATSMGDILRGPLRAYRLEKQSLWHHSLGTGIAASSLCANGSKEERERAFTAGVVHDIGKLLLEHPLRDQLEELPRSDSVQDLLAAERAILGFDHPQAGAALAEAWNFPADLVAAIGAHHAPARAAETEHAALVRAVAAANTVTLMSGLGYGLGAGPEDVALDPLDDLGIEADAARDLAGRLPHDLQNLLALLGEKV